MSTIIVYRALGNVPSSLSPAGEEVRLASPRAVLAAGSCRWKGSFLTTTPTARPATWTRTRRLKRSRAQRPPAPHSSPLAMWGPRYRRGPVSDVNLQLHTHTHTHTLTLSHSHSHWHTHTHTHTLRHKLHSNIHFNPLPTKGASTLPYS